MPHNFSTNYNYESADVSGWRVKNVQAYLRNGINAPSKDNVPDGMLCILGVDGLFNAGMRELANYLTLGALDTDLGDLLDDTMIMVKPNSVHVHMTLSSYDHLAPVVHAWRNVVVHCFDPSTNNIPEDDIQEEVELYKIHSFIKMVADCKVIAIPYSQTGHSKPFKPFHVEKWPIVQAFGLDGIGPGGFFTMSHTVVDASGLTPVIFSTLDCRNIEQLMLDGLSCFSRHWADFISKCDRSPADNPLDVADVGEPLFSYYQFGRCSGSEGRGVTHSYQPFILLGSMTSALKAPITEAVNGRQASHSSGNDVTGHIVGDVTNPIHMVIQGVQPKGPLVCRRSYFLVPENQSKDSRMLSLLYKAMVTAFYGAVKVYLSSLSASKAVDSAKESFEYLLEKWQIESPEGLLESLSFRIESRGNLSEILPLLNGKPSPFVKIAIISLSDISSLVDTERNLGSLSFSETFVDAVTVFADGSSDSEVVYLTRILPIFASFFPPPLPSLPEKPLLSDTDCVFLASSKRLQTAVSSIRCHASGILFQPRRLDSFILPLSALHSVRYYDGPSPTRLLLIAMRLKPDYLAILPTALVHSDGLLYMGVPFASRKVNSGFKSEILSKWRAAKLADVVETLSDVEKVVYEGLVRSSRTPSRFHTAVQYDLAFPELRSLYSQLSISCAADHGAKVPLSIKHGLAESARSSAIPITVIVSGGRVAELLVADTSSTIRWESISQPVELPGFNPDFLTESLRDSIDSLRSVVDPSRKPRILLDLPYLFEVHQLVALLRNLPDVFLAAVAVCLDPDGLYVGPNRRIVPGLLAHCARGWTSAVILRKTERTCRETQQRIREFNSNVAFILTDEGRISRGPDIEILLDNEVFPSRDMERARFLSIPGWWNNVPPFYSVHDIHAVVVRSDSVLDRPRFLGKIKSLRVRNDEFTAIIKINSAVYFSDNKREIYNISWDSPSGKLLIESSGFGDDYPPDSFTSIVTFIGFDLSTEELKMFLEQSLPPKLEAKPLRRRSDLTSGELAQLTKKHHLDSLPEGWYYNGSSYVSGFGDKSPSHPLMEEHIMEYLEVDNKRIEARNEKIKDDVEAKLVSVTSQQIL